MSDPPVVQIAKSRRTSFESPEAAYTNFKSKQIFKTWDDRALSAYVLYGFRRAPDGSWTLKCTPPMEAKSYLLHDAQKFYQGLSKITTELVIMRCVCCC